MSTLREIDRSDLGDLPPTMYTLEWTQVIPAPLEVAFKFFEDPHNLRLITPDWLDFRIVSIRGTPLDVGTTMRYRIRWLGLRITWMSRITDFERNRRFVDVQIRGPYRSWRHEHTFEERDGETFMRDRVHYELPLGFLGRIVHRLSVRCQLRDIFKYRASQIKLIFASSGGGRPSPDST